MGKILIFLLMATSIFTQEPQGRDPKEDGLTYAIGEQIDDFEIRTLDGRKKVNLSDFRGKKVLLNFTTTWCPDCTSEKEIFSKEYNEIYKDRVDVEYLVVFGPYRKENLESVRDYIIENNYTFPTYYDTKDKDLFTQFGVKYVPTTFLIDENGVLQDINVESGYKNMEYFKKLN